jgi:hypothetical protein
MLSMRRFLVFGVVVGLLAGTWSRGTLAEPKSPKAGKAAKANGSPETAKGNSPGKANSGKASSSKGGSAKKGKSGKSASKSGDKKGNLPTAGRLDAKTLNVAKVDPQTQERNRLAAAKIDSLVEANYKRFSIEPNPLTSDEQFVRRIYLDITGTIPTYEQTIVFLDSKDPEKREKLIDRLLNSPGYVSHSFNYWANILRLVDYPENNLPAAPYLDWIKQSLRENKPYDELVREMLTAGGKVWDNPAAGYLLRDSGMPLDSMNNTVRVFLGTQIGCAQCHDHPFDRWKQHEFYEMAAYMYGIRTRGGRSASLPVEQLRKELSKLPGANGAIQLIRANSYQVADVPKQVLKLPHDYQYDDGKPGEVVKPKAIFGEAELSPGEPPRATFARWLTAKENPRFAKTIANRLWKRALGVGIIEPVDDMKDNSQPENAELLDYLTTIVVKLDFDLKEYQRIIYYTKTYQRQASTTEPPAGEPYHFPGPVLRRMTAEQVWDSLLTLAIYNPDAIHRPAMDGVASVANIATTDTPKEIADKWQKFNGTYGKKSMQDMKQKYGYKGQLLARASELPLPAPPGHFLREFGQGDREQIEAGSTEGNVPQILTMFNGPVTHMMLEAGSVIYDEVVKRKTAAERVDVIFLTLLSRRPDSGARQLAIHELNSNGLAGCGDVIWSLLNTREFLFIQ